MPSDLRVRQAELAVLAAAEAWVKVWRRPGYALVDTYDQANEIAHALAALRAARRRAKPPRVEWVAKDGTVIHAEPAPAKRKAVAPKGEKR